MELVAPGYARTLERIIPMFVSASRSFGWLRSAGLALLVWGAALATVHRYGSDVPYFDQWDAEGRLLFLPYAQGTLGVSAFFASHNEHRVTFTRVLEFALFLGNGQWDSRLECVVNALLRAVIVVLVARWSWAVLEPRWRWPALVLLALLVAIPISWENMLGGFHSQWYFLIGFSLFAAGGLLGAPPGGRRWWTGAACALAALFSMASGPLAAITVGATVLAGVRSRAEARTQAATLVVCALIAGLGLALYQPSAGDDVFHARSVPEAFSAFKHYIGWSYERFAWYRNARMIVLPLLEWLPWLWLLARLVRAGNRAHPTERILFAVGLWTLLQFAASAYARGAGSPWIPSRYVDTVTVGTLTNVLALFWLAPRADRSRPVIRCLLAYAATGVVITLFGTLLNTRHVLQEELPFQRDHLARSVANTRAYLASGDPAALATSDIPYPNADQLAERLSHPEIRAILPVSLQPSTAPMGPLSRVAAGLARAWAWLVGLGAALLALSPWRMRRSGGEGRF